MKRAPATGGHMRLEQVAEYFGHSKSWVSRQIKRGVFEAFRHSPNDITVSRVSVERYEGDRRVSYARAR